MAQLEQWMLKPLDDNIMILIEPILNESNRRYILITHDESVFYANDGVNHNGWWKTEDLIKQITEKAILIFEKLHTSNISVFTFNNATSHAAYAKDALIASKMNLNPGGKRKFRNGIMPDRSIQLMHFSDGRPKGIRLILKECKLWPEKSVNCICSDYKKHSPIANDCYAV
ncbi:hypothetical protein RclHR1_06330004 [Rhizophagus clarus]|uniref:Uncharacterized protein n=1 Tax=Rhizophagus clarus TaxID=94130 RepID=A0A2Z6RSF6_9GLOM|nr:hypothetical protein RclHR1_06330004 [Rhizophagus clarus]GES77997.1 hypothetical protein RCL_jg29499.t1 [Rhizophagus clarus]